MPPSTLVPPQDPVPLEEFDEWVQCSVPGIKADMTAVNLTASEKVRGSRGACGRCSTLLGACFCLGLAPAPPLLG